VSTFDPAMVGGGGTGDVSAFPIDDSATDPNATTPPGRPDDDNELDETEEVEEETWVPPTKEEWEAAQGKLKRAREQARKERERRQAALAPNAQDPASTATNESSAEVAKWQNRAIDGYVRAGLAARGLDEKYVPLLKAQLDYSKVDFDDDVPELDDWFDDMEDRFPGLFVAKTQKTSNRRAAAPPLEQGRTTSSNNGSGKPRSITELMLAASEREHGFRTRRR